jgi:VanZ family protein
VRPLTDRQRRTLSWAYVALVLFATLAPLPGGGPDAPGLDKVAHVVLFGGLTVALFTGGILPSIAAAFAITMAAAGAIEGLQYVVGYRSPEWLDFFAGTVGAFVAAVTLTWMASARRARDQ